MDIQETRHGAAAVLVPRGESEARAFQAIEARVAALLAAGVRGIVVDLTPIVLLSSTYAGLLVSCAARARQAGARFALVVPSARVRRTLAILGVDVALSVCEGLPAALTSVAEA